MATWWAMPRPAWYPAISDRLCALNLGGWTGCWCAEFQHVQVVIMSGYGQRVPLEGWTSLMELLLRRRSRSEGDMVAAIRPYAQAQYQHQAMALAASSRGCSTPSPLARVPHVLGRGDSGQQCAHEVGHQN